MSSCFLLRHARPKVIRFRATPHFLPPPSLPLRAFSTEPGPLPSFASTVGRKPGLIPLLLNKKDGSPRSKRKGVLIALTTSLLLGTLTALTEYIQVQEGHAIIAWNLVQCYRTDIHYPSIDFSSDYRASTEYFRDLVAVLLVNVHDMEHDTVIRFFEAVAQWDDSPSPSPSHTEEFAVKEGIGKKTQVHRIFRKTAGDVHRLLERCDEMGVGLVETGLEAVKLLNEALLEFARTVGVDEDGKVVIDVRQDKVDRFKEWDTVD